MSSSTPTTVSMPKTSSAQVDVYMRIRRRSQELVPPRRSRPLRHDDRLCYFDWLISV